MKYCKKDFLFVLILMIVSGLVTLFLHPKFSQIGTDYSIYSILGKNIFNGDGFTLFGVSHSYFSPLMPLLIGFFSLFMNLEVAAYVAVVVIAIASLPIFYLLMNKIYARSSKIALLFFTLNGFLIWNYAVNPTPQIVVSFLSIFLFFSALKMVRSVNGFKEVFIWSCITGVLLGLEYLNRPEYFFLIFPLMIYVYIFLKGAHNLRQLGKILLVCFTGFFVVVFPYLFYLKINLGYWTVSGRTEGLSLSVTEIDGESQDSLANIDGSSDVIQTIIVNGSVRSDSMIFSAISNYGLLIKRFLDNLLNIQFWFLKAFGILGVVFFGFGIAHFILKKKYEEIYLSLMFLLPIIPLALAIDGVGKANYLIQFSFLFVIYISVGFFKFHDEVVKVACENKKWQIGIFVALILVSSGYFFFPVVQNYLFLPKDYKVAEFKMLGSWMKDNIDDIKNETVLARKPEYAFYANSKWHNVPNVDNLDRLVELMKFNKIKYLIIDDRSFFGTRPLLYDLINYKDDLMVLKKLHEVSYLGNRAAVYVLNDENIL